LSPMQCGDPVLKFGKFPFVAATRFAVAAGALNCTSIGIAMTPFIESNDILADVDALLSRVDRDGYLFLRHLVDGEPILKVRRDIASTLQDAGCIDTGSNPSEAKTCYPARIASTDEHKPVYDRVQKLEIFQSLAHNHALFRIARVLLGPDVLL